MFQFMLKNSVKSVDVNEMDKLIGKVELIDIREPYEYKAGHLPTAKNITMDTILKQPEKYLDKSKEYHIICQSGSRSSRTCKILKEHGFNIVNVAGGTGRYIGKLER
ncbi:rhodanese-like domain-containing protein [Clostridium sp. SYSU_GA19001]|uniref:rhodanese-like domain-containing protein n=1 Tax=Clostridium caldaquaticum TaxID=2940653 RepID=UPI0020778E62|nr:rhodanese-like domain-containing protein [Clostridium caldaquaticum]MCM8709994.1 rhodanese-like domain-containing protein [Clostridium caldaquaticum]